MSKRDQIINELDRGLSHLEEQEKTLANRSASLLASVTVMITVVISLVQRNIQPPIFLIVLYVLAAIASSFSISGRRLINPSVNHDVRGHWAHLTDDEVYEVLFESKRLALRANGERVSFVRVAFMAHLGLVTATLATSLVLLWSYR